MCVCTHQWSLLLTKLLENKTQICENTAAHSLSSFSLGKNTTQNTCLMFSLAVCDELHPHSSLQCMKTRVLKRKNSQYKTRIDHHLWVEERTNLGLSPKPLPEPCTSLQDVYKRLKASLDVRSKQFVSIHSPSLLESVPAAFWKMTTSFCL